MKSLTSRSRNGITKSSAEPESKEGDSKKSQTGRTVAQSETSLLHKKRAKRGQRILLVDDDVLFLGSGRRYLQRAGYDVMVACDGCEAIESISRVPVDLVIMDIFMPRKGGLEAIREIRKTMPALKIVAVSGGGIYDAEVLLHLGLKFGAVRTLEKPFEGSELLATLEELLGNRLL